SWSELFDLKILVTRWVKLIATLDSNFTLEMFRDGIVLGMKPAHNWGLDQFRNALHYAAQRRCEQLVTNSVTHPSWVRSRHPCAVTRLENRLNATDRIGTDHLHLVAHRSKARNRFRRKPGFCLDSDCRCGRIEPWIRIQRDPGRLDRRLHRHAAIDDVDQVLELRLADGFAAGRAKDHLELALVHDDRRTVAQQWNPSPFDEIGVIAIGRGRAGTQAVVTKQARIAHHNTGAEATAQGRGDAHGI